ncbi:hypothetical protein [Frigoriglobus tundricola]|uniref:Uncharacterized protein n=1 Tax=Frigoriglobus tundricola TaxID=2774151 RepID=A0A6M5YXX0_9BACT|nr:hypothetical protein [Frigoriglobus tundricola]QJW98859.1 hypothetical protein FTUN_6454 [Frigoriglobus tundricola]
MGLTVYYYSTRPLAPAEADTIRRAAEVANEGRTWLGCEPVHFFPSDPVGHLLGGSKANLQPHPDDAASAARSELPDGTTRDMLDVLCQLSRDHAIDWALSHDYNTDLGFIRAGVCDGDVLAQIEAFADLGDALGDDALGDFDLE